MMMNESVLNDISKVKNGTFTRLCYVTDVPVNALAKKCGVRIKKYVESTVRLGINYGHLASVKNRPHVESDSKPRTNNFVPYLGNKISYNTNTDDYYLNVFTTPNSNSKVKYVQYMSVDGEDISDTTWYGENKELLSPWVTPSYLKKHDTPIDMYRVKMSNVMRVGK